MYSDAEEDDGEDELVMRQRKPWGDTAHFCPVALAEKGVLWPGNQDTAARYNLLWATFIHMYL